MGEDNIAKWIESKFIEENSERLAGIIQRWRIIYGSEKEDALKNKLVDFFDEFLDNISSESDDLIADYKSRLECELSRDKC